MEGSNKQELKLQLKNCQLESCSILNKPLVEVLGVEKSKATIVLQQLLKQGFKTWGDLRCSLLKSSEIIDVIGGDKVNGRTLWSSVWDHENRMAATNNIGQGTIPLAKVEHTFAEDENFWSNQNELEFVQPSQFRNMFRTIEWSMRSSKPRWLHYVACEGISGGGRTRCGKELVLKAAASPSKWPWKRGYVSAGFLPQFAEADEQDLGKCNFVFAWALCCAFGIPPLQLVNYKFDWRAVIKKLHADFSQEKLHVLLLVDDFHLNPYAVRMLMTACIELWDIYGMNVVPIFAGDVSKVEISPSRSEKIDHHTIESLPLDAMSTSFARRIGIESSVLERCPLLQNLVTECNGHPALLELLATNILRLDDSYLARLRQEGILDVAVAHALYQELINFIKERYSLSDWNYALFGKETTQHTREIVTKLLLDALVTAHVRHFDPVVQACPQVTYKCVETTGLICLEPREDGQRRMGGVAQVVLPALAMVVMNQELNLLDEEIFKIFKNPIECGFQNHEQLAMANLQARIMRSMKDSQYKYPDNTFPYEDLRNFACAIESSTFRRSWVNIEIPKTNKVWEVRQLFHGDKVDLRPVNNNQIESFVEESAVKVKEKMAEPGNDTSMDIERLNEGRFIIENNDSMNDSRKALKLASECSELIDESDESFQEDEEGKAGNESVLEEATNERFRDERGNSSFQSNASSDSTTKTDPIVLHKTNENDGSLSKIIEEESPEHSKDERVIQAVAGTFLIASVDNEAIHGAALFRGILEKRNNQPCWVLVLSLSEWSHQVDARGTPLPLGTAKKCQSIRVAIEKLSGKKDEVIRTWLGANVKDPVVVVYDIFTDCISKSELVDEDIGLNDDDLCACLITTADNVQKVVEPGFGVRARMKWILQH